MADYRKIPYVVEAIQWMDDENSTIELVDLFQMITATDRTKCHMHGYEGVVEITWGDDDYIIRKGDFVVLDESNRVTVMRPEKFEETYEPTVYSTRCFADNKIPQKIGKAKNS